MPLRKTTLVVALVALSLLAGCKKKKPGLPPPQAQAPTVTAPAQPPTQQKPAPAAHPAPESKQPEATAPNSNTTAAKPKPKPKPPRTATRKTTPATPPAPKPSQPAETAIAKAPASQPAGPSLSRTPNSQPAPDAVQITPGMPHDEALHRRLTTEQLLQSTEQNLTSIRRALNADEQEMVQQIRLYMQQSRSATTDGDLVRAHNLALKSHLLSDELVKP